MKNTFLQPILFFGFTLSVVGVLTFFGCIAKKSVANAKADFARTDFVDFGSNFGSGILLKTSHARIFSIGMVGMGCF